MARVHVIQEVDIEVGDWRLCFQWGRWDFDDGNSGHGFRFIWRDQAGRLQPYRGQTRIYQVEYIQTLLRMAEEEGWLQNRAEDASR